MSTILTTSAFPTAEAIKNSVLGVIGAIQENEDKKNATFSAKSTLREGLLSEIQIRNFTLRVDEPESLGGTDLGPNPVELILGALGACQEIVFKTYASVLGIDVKAVHIEARGHLNLKGFFNPNNSRVRLV